MEKEHPPWLNENFLATVLQGGEDMEPQITVNNFTARLAVAPGNNYLSNLFRVTVDYKIKGFEEKKQTKSLIIKAPITKGFVSSMSDRMDVFGKELRAYKELLLKVNEKLNLVISPSLYYCPAKAIILQDMKEDGYVMCDKHKLLDYTHCTLALTTLAKFHAATVACYHDDPEFIKTIGEERMFVEGDENLEAQTNSWIELSIKTVASYTAEMDGCQLAAEYLLKRVDGIAYSLTNLCKPKLSGLNVLNHGDLWVNNMLFKYNGSKELEDVKFIDFQLLRYGSPVLDIVYFLWTSCKEEVRVSRLEELYYSYIKTLNATLEEVGCEERLTDEEFLEDLTAATDWIIIVVCSFLPMMQVESEDALVMEGITEEDLTTTTDDKQPDDKFMKMYRSKRYLELLPSIMKQFYTIVSS